MDSNGKLKNLKQNILNDEARVDEAKSRKLNTVHYKRRSLEKAIKKYVNSSGVMILWSKIIEIQRKYLNLF